MSRYVLLLLVATAFAADQDCNCENSIEDEANIVRYLKQLSVDVPEEDRVLYSVIPGVLSPLAYCDCEENNREKRKVDSSEVPEIPESAESLDHKQRKPHHKFNTRNCARGYRRLGFLCVLERD